MALNDVALNESPLGGDDVGEFDGGELWGFIAGELVSDDAFRIGTLEVEDTLGQRSTARVVLVNPVSAPLVGQTIEIVWNWQTIFSGTIDKHRLTTKAEQRVREYAIDAVSWEQVLDRIIVSPAYTDQTIAFILEDLHTLYLEAEGIGLGQIDEGLTLTLARGDKVRLSEFIRDIAEASGGIYFIHPATKQLHFHKTTVEEAPFELTEDEVEAVELEETREQYRNRQEVRVQGTGSNVTTVEREDTAEQAARVALEGGTGVYTVFEEISHPTSDDVVELERLGIAYALIQLQRSGRITQRFTATLRRPLVRVGELITVDLPVYGLAGQWQVTRLRTADQFGKTPVFEMSAALTSPYELALDAWLRIVGAGRAAVQVQGVGLFETLETFTASDTWEVPDANGDMSPVEVEVDAYGGGGGGGGGFIGFDPPFEFNGGGGGAGGRATTFRTLAVGTVLTITVGAGGAAGVNDATLPFDGNTDGAAGALSKVEQSGVLLCRGDAGTGGGRSTSQNGAPGTQGGGEGDFVAAGGAGNGGQGFQGAAETGPTAGGNGYVEIRY